MGARADPWHEQWLEDIFRCLSGELPPEQMVAAAEAGDAHRQCEAFYYAGERRRLQGESERARHYFERCRATGAETDADDPINPMSEFELAGWRLGLVRPASSSEIAVPTGL